MIQLIVSDIDGTLLPYGQKQLDPSIFFAHSSSFSAGNPILPRFRAAVSFAAKTVRPGAG